jgi:hypothetical protein
MASEPLLPRESEKYKLPVEFLLSVNKNINLDSVHKFVYVQSMWLISSSKWGMNFNQLQMDI